MMTKPISALAAAAAAAALSACSLIPAYEAPLVNIPASFPYDAAASQDSAPIAAVGWQDWFADPRLHRLIELALSCNTDLRQAALNAEAV